MDTYITLTILSVGMVWLVYWILKNFYEHDYKKNYTTLNKPLDNKGKWWYN